MSNLKNQLVRLGYERPELRCHLRPVLNELSTKTASDDSLMSQIENWALDSLGRKIMNAFGNAFGFQKVLRQDIKPHGGGKYTMALADGDKWKQVSIHLDFQMGELVPTIKALGSLFTEDGEEHVFVQQESVGSAFDSPDEIASNLVNAARQV